MDADWVRPAVSWTEDLEAQVEGRERELEWWQAKYWQAVRERDEARGERDAARAAVTAGRMSP